MTLGQKDAINSQRKDVHPDIHRAYRVVWTHDNTIGNVIGYLLLNSACR